MPRRGSPYGPAYERDRVALLRVHRWCVHCGAPATEADHQPPIELHPGGRGSHRHGSGCCRLVPSCGPCQRRQGGLIRERAEALELVGVRGVEEVEMPEPVGFDVLDPVWAVGWLEDLREVPENAVWPRLMTVPHPRAVGSLGVEFEEWVRGRTGRRLRWHQRLIVRRLLEVDVDGRLVWDAAILSMARQQGKSWLLAELMMWRLHHGVRFGERQTVLHTGMNLDVCRALFLPEATWCKLQRREVVTGEVGEDGSTVVRSGPAYDVREVNSQESIRWLEDGSEWLIRSRGATYGKTTGLGVVDEAWKVKASDVDDGIEPTTVEAAQSQLVLVSTAHRLATSLMLGRRAVALLAFDSGDGDLLIEWSAPRGVDITDESAWRMASPHWTDKRRRMIAKKVANALGGGKSDDPDEPDPVEAVLAQWLNVWPSRQTVSGRGELLFDTGAWDAAEDDQDVVGPLVLAVEDWVGTGVGAAYAGRVGDRIVCGGYLFGQRADAYAWVRHFAADRPGSTLLVGLTLRDDSELKAFPATVDTRSSADTRSALSLLRELVAAGRVVHDGSAEVREQMIQARVTPAAAGGLSLVNAGRLDLVRAVAWAVAEADRDALVVPMVHGGPLTSA